MNIVIEVPKEKENDFKEYLSTLERKYKEDKEKGEIKICSAYQDN